MSDPVKPPVKRGTRRGEQARATRRRIIDAAAELFIANGYVATTLDQIATHAGVAVQTVYFHFGNKRTVLKEVVDVAVVGDDEPVPLLDRPEVTRVHLEPDPRRVIELWVHNARDIAGRISPIMRMVHDAAVSDPDMRAQWETNEQQRLVAFRTLAQLLVDRDALKPGMSPDEAVDVIFTLLSIEVYLLFTENRGWTLAHWERWTATTLAATLLR